jgi:hypothetical protein
MHKRIRILVVILLILSIANFSRLGIATSIRAVDFLSILVMGGLAGILLKDLMSMSKK